MTGCRLLVGAALLSACTGQTASGPPAPVTADTVTVWVTDMTDTLTLHADSLLHLLHAVALRWSAADTTDATALISRGALPLVAHGPFNFATGFPAESVTRQPLPWGRLYVLISDSIVPVPALADSGSTASVRDDLARFAVTTDAEPSMTDPLLGLPCDSTIVRANQVRPRISYLSSDTVARQIAERLAALAGVVAAPLAAREFGWAMSDGRDAGVVAAVPLLAGAARPAVFCGARVTALIETRATLFLRTRQ